MLFLCGGPAGAVEVELYPELVSLVDTMAGEDGYPRAELEAILERAHIDESVIRSMDRQYEALPWHKYRQLFINEERIRKGVAYREEHEAVLLRAQAEFGVPPDIITALIGVETNFGTHTGDKRTLDALVTLTAAYPRRSAYFRKELRAFLNTARAENIAAESVTGSFAGAVGIPQFMPTSYQAYAVDFNGNDRRDLVNETADAIGSVANYLARHGWVAGQAIIAPLEDGIPQSAAELVSRKARPKLTAGQLAAAGVEVDTRTGSRKMALLRLQEVRGYRYFIGFKNFHAITRYNPSVNYAMVVTELAGEIRRRRES